MKKINSIGYGGKVIGIGVIFAIVFPSLIMLFGSLFFSKSTVLRLICKISIIIGILVLIGFFLLLTIELHQDKRLNHYYEENKDRVHKIGEHTYECQACGNRQVKEGEKSCTVCGIQFHRE